MLDWKHKLLLGVIAAGLLGGVFGFRTWIAEHDARLQAEASAKAQDAVRADLKQQMDALAKQAADRDAAYQSQLKTLDTKFSQAASPADLAQLVSQLMGLKQPIQVIQPPASDGNAHPAAIAQIPQIDFPQAKAYLQDCESCKLDRAKLQADAADRAQQMALAQKQIEAITKERDTWEKAAKGGNLWQRMGRGAKLLVIGGAGAAVAMCVTGHCK